MEEIQAYREPFAHFADWYTEAEQTVGLDVEAMALATADKKGKPAVRMVYFRGMSKHQVKFYSNYNSRKGRELQTNKRAALLFYWQAHNRQIRIEGVVAKMPRSQSEKYFASRPLSSQISSYLSQQSKVIVSYQDFRQEFEKKVAEHAQDTTLSCPEHWGGYLLTPDRFEFYQGREHRLNERLLYLLADKEWQTVFLSP